MFLCCRIPANHSLFPVTFFVAMLFLVFAAAFLSMLAFMSVVFLVALLSFVAWKTQQIKIDSQHKITKFIWAKQPKVYKWKLLNIIIIIIYFDTRFIVMVMAFFPVSFLSLFSMIKRFFVMSFLVRATFFRIMLLVEISVLLVIAFVVVFVEEFILLFRFV